MLSLYPENIHQPIVRAQRRQLWLFIMFLTRALTVLQDFQYQVFPRCNTLNRRRARE